MTTSVRSQFANRTMNRRVFATGIAGSAAALAFVRRTGAQDASPVTNTATYPLEISGEYGTTVIPEQPERVVTLGWTDVDVALALGVIPVGVYQFTADMTRGVGAWAENLLGDANPYIFESGADIDLEALVGLQPDLITAVERLDNPNDYEMFAAVAPTLGLPAGATPYGVPWQDITRVVSTALGYAGEGEALVEQTESLLATTASQHPEFAGKTFSVVLAYDDKLGYWTTADSRVQLVSALGLEPSQFVQDAGTDTFFEEISLERAGDLEADVVIFLSYLASTLDELKEQYPGVAGMTAVQEGRAIAIDDMDLNLGLSIASVLSIPFSIEELGIRLNEIIPAQ